MGGRYQHGQGGGCCRPPPPPPKVREGDSEKNKGGEGGERGRRIVLIQRKVGKMGNLGRTTGWIHMAALVKIGCVHNSTNRMGCTIPYSQRGRRNRVGGERGRVELSRWITLWFALDRTPRKIWISQREGGGGRGRGGRWVIESSRSRRRIRSCTR